MAGGGEAGWVTLEQGRDAPFPPEAPMATVSPRSKRLFLTMVSCTCGFEGIANRRVQDQTRESVFVCVCVCVCVCV